MIDIKQLANTKIRGSSAITFPLHVYCGVVTDKAGNHILDIRGWGRIQYLGEGAEKLQDDIGQWVVDTLNKEYESLNLDISNKSVGE